MSDHAGFCDCPVLRYAAATARLAKHGIVAEDGDVISGVGRILTVAMLRDEHGCRGPGRRPVDGVPQCPWDSMFHGVKLKCDENVPLLRPPDKGGVLGLFL
jgi:hypothetical protein